MLNVDKKNFYITKKIDIGSKKIERYLINQVWLIEYNWLRLHDDRYIYAN